MITPVFFIAFGPLLFWFFRSEYLLNKLKGEGRESVVADSIEALPAGFTQAGVLGTFIGIAVGLFAFDVNDIQASVPDLLEGLTGAFITSIAGIIFSMIYRSRSAGVWNRSGEDEVDDGRSETELLRDILLATQSGYTTMNQSMDSLLKGLVGDGDSSLTTAMSRMRNDARDEAKQNRDHLEAQLSALRSNLESNHTDLLKAVEGFGDQLAKNNVDLLVEAMNKATEQFHEQMKTIVERLVKENFEQLNTSVQRMNDWQVENKEMVATMTGQFKEVIEGVEQTGQTLTGIGTTVEGMTEQVNAITDRTAQLTDEGGKLQELLSALSQVMVEEDKFKSLAELLAGAVSDVKGSTDQLSATSEKLGDWTRENQEMVSGLTGQYQSVVSGFGEAEQSIQGISTTVVGIVEQVGTMTSNTQSLTSDNGKLVELIGKLQQVMVEEDKFAELASKLSKAVKNIDKSTGAFTETTGKLETWTQDQKDFRKSSEDLLRKFDEIAKIKDTNEFFWKDVKKKLTEGSDVIRESNENLMNNLQEINKEFTGRTEHAAQKPGQGDPPVHDGI